VAPTEGAFAGVYTVTVTDGKGFTDWIEVKVPLEFVPETKNILGGETFVLTIRGADEFKGPGDGAQITEGEFLDRQGQVIPPEEDGNYAEVAEILPIPFDADSEAFATITGADVEALKVFKIMIEVTGDPDLT
jgi:hypothetical protein